MKEMKKITLFFAAIVMLLASCQTKQSATRDLRALSQEMEINGQGYTLNQWTEAGKDYYKINKRISKHAGDYTDEEVQEISRLNGQCLRNLTEGAVTKVTGAVKAIESLIKGFNKE